MTSDTKIVRVKTIYEEKTVGWVLHQCKASATFAQILQEIFDGQNPCVTEFMGLNLRVSELKVRCTIIVDDTWATTPLGYPLDGVFSSSQSGIALVKYDVVPHDVECAEVDPGNLT